MKNMKQLIRAAIAENDLVLAANLLDDPIIKANVIGLQQAIDQFTITAKNAREERNRLFAEILNKSEGVTDHNLVGLDLRPKLLEALYLTYSRNADNTAVYHLIRRLDRLNESTTISTTDSWDQLRAEIESELKTWGLL